MFLFRYSFMVNDLLVEEMGQASVTGFVVIQVDLEVDLCTSVLVLSDFLPLD